MNLTKDFNSNLINEISIEPKNAVAALLTMGKGKYIMQLRDSKPNIFYPDHWGCFGGAVEIGESPEEAIKREVFEEVEFKINELKEFTQFDFNFAPIGYGKVSRIYYCIDVNQNDFENFKLHEGAGLNIFNGDYIINHLKVTPYDSFAIWMHIKSNFNKFID